MKTKLKLKFITRLKLAAAAFRGKPFEVEVEPLHCKGQLTGHVKCDNNYHSMGQQSEAARIKQLEMGKKLEKISKANSYRIYADGKRR